jgi:hypothetical protein
MGRFLGFFMFDLNGKRLSCNNLVLIRTEPITEHTYPAIIVNLSDQIFL